MKVQPSTGLMRVFVNVIDATGVETGAAPDDAVDGVAFRKKQLTQVGAILACDAGY
jgi:hypothetical protein